MRKASGFTLIEMMIVVAIIAILAAIATPNYLRSRMQANESSAVGDLRIVCEAQITYNAANGVYGDFEALTGGEATQFLRGHWINVKRNGYVFAMEDIGRANFICYADPVSLGKTGTRYFRVDASGNILFSAEGRPAADATPLGS